MMKVIVAAAVAIACYVAPCSAQQASDAAPPVVASAADFAAPLLREGSQLLDVHARLVRDPAREWWLLVIEPQQAQGSGESAAGAAGAAGAEGAGAAGGGPSGGQQPIELIPLPCTRLTEMQRVLESMAGGRDSKASGASAKFLVSGTVFVYRDRNYILPTQAAMLSETADVSMTEAEQVDPSVTVPAADPSELPTAAPSNPAAPPAPDDDSAEAIARRLAEASGPLARSAAPTIATNDAPRDTRAGAREPTGADTSGAVGTERAARTTAENAALVARRGRLMRDRGGGWLFVFDADASGLADPPMRLMPCLLLERIEGYAQRTGHNAPALLSGEVFLHEGRNYLLPTVFRIPRDVTPINP